jgi:hypothetical protein
MSVHIRTYTHLNHERLTRRLPDAVAATARFVKHSAQKMEARRFRRLGGQACRLRRNGVHETEHGLLQLRIHFVCDGHHVEQHGAEIDLSQIVLQSFKDTHLQHARFFDDHGDRVALEASQNPVLACSF